MRNRTLNSFVLAVACMLLVITAGCQTTGGEKPLAPLVEKLPVFPPQGAMQNGSYAAFKAENEEALKSCKEPEKCATALLNMSFLYSYSKSPYFNPARGILYLQDLIKGSPETPLAYQARLWIDLMKKGAPKIVKKRPAKGDAKSRETAEEATKPAESPIEGVTPVQAEGVTPVQAEGPPDGMVREADRQQFEDEIRNRDETIRELNRQIERSRQIDMEIERKQRFLRY